MEKEIIIAVAAGLGLSASCGFRVFVPMLVAGIAAKTGLFPVTEGFQWLSGWPAIICFGTATVQSGSVLTRLASTKLTAGTGNAVVATGEHAAAFGISVLSLFIPLFIAALLILLMVYIILKFGKKIFNEQSPKKMQS